MEIFKFNNLEISYYHNQKVCIENKNKIFECISEQSGSTPGIKFFYNFEKNKLYELTIKLITNSKFKYLPLTSSTLVWSEKENVIDGIEYQTYLIESLEEQNNKIQNVLFCFNVPNKNDFFKLIDVDIKIKDMSLYSNYYFTTSTSAIFFSNKIVKNTDCFMCFPIKNQKITTSIFFKNKILLLIGLYWPEKYDLYYKNLFNIVDKVIILWAGTDILQLDTNMNDIERNKLLDILRNNKKIISVAENDHIINKMNTKYNLNTKLLPLPIDNYNINEINNNFDKLIISLYLPQTRKDFFNYDLILNIAIKRPQYTFIFYDHNGIETNDNEKNLKNCIFIKKPVTTPFDIYKIVNCGMRITEHDGEPLTGIEMMSLGLHFVFNHDLKHAIKVEKNEDDILLKLDNLNNNLLFNKEGNEYYTKRNSINSFLTNFENLIK